MSGLLPCPFCGGEDLEIEHAPTYMKTHPDVSWVLCPDCGARGSEEWTKDIAIAAWNTRAERTCQRKLFGWQPGKMSQEVHYVCSECEEPLNRRTNYCPNCGAKVVEK